LVCIFYICFEPTLLFLRPSPGLSKKYFNKKRPVFCFEKNKIGKAGMESEAGQCFVASFLGRSIRTMRNPIFHDCPFSLLLS